MRQFLTSAVLHQEMTTDEIWQTRAGLEAIVPRDRATRFKFDTCEEITDLFKLEHRTAGPNSLGGQSRRTDRSVLKNNRILSVEGRFQRAVHRHAR